MSDKVAAATSTSGRGSGRWWLAGLVVVVLVAAAVVVFRDTAPAQVERIELTSGALAGWNVLLVSMDTVRRDRLHCYGREQIDTPIVDQLARTGIRFDQAITPVPMTLPGHASMLTGLNPMHHGARVNGMFKLDENVPTIQGELGKRGYRTGAVIAAFVLDRRYGLSRAFDTYDDDLTGGRQSYQFSYRERPAERVNAAATAWLRKDPSKPFFLFVHYFDPHWPYSAPEPFASKYKDNEYGGYDGEIAYTDDQLGKLLNVLDELGVRDRTLVVVVSDHGEGLGQHDEHTHSLLVYDTTLLVPMIFSGPSPIPHNRLVSRQVGLIDLAPTILDLLGAPIPASLDGTSLLAPPPAGPRSLYIETLATKFMHGWAPLVGVRRDDVKLILAPECELYDLRADPSELENVLKSRPETVSEMRETLATLVGGDPELATAVTASMTMDAEALEKLRDLGYVMSASAPATTASATRPKALPDPKAMILAQRRIQQAQTMMQQGQHREALLLIEPYVKENAGDGLGLHVIGECYHRLGMLDKALEVFRRASRLTYQPAVALAGVANVLLAQGKLDQAEAAALQALVKDPSCMAAMLNLGLVRARQQREDEAMATLSKVIELGRGTFDGQAYLAIAKIHVDRGRKAQAREALKKALAVDPTQRGAIFLLAKLAEDKDDREAAVARLRKRVETSPDPVLLGQLGEMELKKGEYERAAGTLRKALALDSQNAEAHYALARALMKTGKPDDALTHLRETVRLQPKNDGALSDLGLALAKRNRLTEARDALRRAAALTPRLPVRRYNLGLVLARLSQWPEAAKHFRTAIQLRPDYPEAHYNLGQVLRMLGQPDEADKHLRRAAELDPKLAQPKE